MSATLEHQVVLYDSMVRAIDQCHAVDQVKDIRDKAMALERYAQQAMNTEAERKACEIRLRAERKAGELLSQQEKAKGAPGPGRGKAGSSAGPAFNDSPTLADHGISKQQSHRWQKLAGVDADTFEAALADPAEKPSTAGIIRKANGDTTSKVHPDALWIWGRARDFERMEISGNDPEMIAGEMTDAMRSDMDRIIPSMVAWLARVERSIGND